MPSSDQTFTLVLRGGQQARSFQASVIDAGGETIADHPFEWRYDSTALNQDLGELARCAIAGKPPKDDLPARFGRMLYDTVFSGPIAQAWSDMRKQTGNNPLRFILRIDPETAHPLLNLPWEYLHDGKDFLTLNRRIYFSRLPFEVDGQPLKPLDGPLRLLIVVAAPYGLSQDEILNTALEEDILLAATAQARQTNRMQVEFAPNGAFSTLQTYLQEYSPHILHFVGHGVFDPVQDCGFLLMEDDDGSRKTVQNDKFAEALSENCTTLRLVTLTACQSARISQNSALSDLGPRLLAKNIPAVVAMQFSVIHRSAIEFWGSFFKSLARQKGLDEALVDARRTLQRSSPNTVDFATPVLYTFDPFCLRVDEDAARNKAQANTPADMSGVTRAGNFVGRSIELRELATRLDPETGSWRAAVIHGLGGMGKTVLAARLAERMGSRLDGVITLRMAPSTTAQGVLAQISEFLLVNNARFINLPAISQFHHTLHQPVSLESKAGLLIQILERLKLLLIFDNCEDILPAGQALSLAAQAAAENPSQTASPALYEELLKLFAILVGSVSRNSRFLFTSRVDFHPVEQGRLAGEIGHRDLGEMGATDAIYLMETLPGLSKLPVSPESSSKPAAVGVTQRDVYARLGGHPYTLGLFAAHAVRSSPAAVLQDLSGVRKELLEFTLMEAAVARLSERARLVLARGAIYDEPVTIEGLAYLVGEAQDCMPDIAAQAAELQQWGLVAQPPGSDLFALHSLARDWARGRLDAEEQLRLRKRAAAYWLGVGQESVSVNPELNAWHYLYEAGAYEQAGAVVMGISEYLHRWGQIELLLRLLQAGVDTLQGQGLAGALHGLGVVLQEVGAYPQARGRYEQSRAILTELGDRAGLAISLHQLGMLHQDQGEYPQARERYEQSRAIFSELGDRAGLASSLHQLGVLHQHQGEYPQARERYEQSLAIFIELGDRAGLARSLHGLGILHYRQGEYPQAREGYEQSRAIFSELGDQAGLAGSLHQLGMLHQHQGEYPQARERYEQSRAIAQELGDRAGLAISLAQLGLLLEQEGQPEQAAARLQQAWAIFDQLGMPERQRAQRDLQRLRETLGEAAFAEAVQAAQANAPAAQPAGKEEGMSLEDLMREVVTNTIAVMVHVPDKKDEWRQSLGQVKAGVQAQGMGDLAAFLDLLCQFVEGASPEGITLLVPDDFAPAWQQILAGISQKNQ